MEDKKLLPPAKASKLPRLFNQAAKYVRFERYTGIDIREQSRTNTRALLKRLDDRTHIPEAERARYGATRFSAEELSFLEFWCDQIMPLFTARHGTEQFAHIQHSGYMMSVGDRRRSDGVHHNSRTGGINRQDYIYFVLGIGAKHPVPLSVSNSKTITLHFNRMTPEERNQYAGMFISGHDDDYARDITYPIILCGSTEYKVNYNSKKRLRTTTFKRADGTLITEILSPADEVFAADPDIDVIFQCLGYKMVEYLRFIGAEFQEEILTCQNVDKIATVFHALFPSYRFPELKIPLKQIPITAPYVEVRPSTEISYKEANEFHQACAQYDFSRLMKMINPTIASVPGKDDDTPLTQTMKETRQYSPELVQLLLDNNADPNAGTYFDSNFSRALQIGDPRLLAIFMGGSSHPSCPHLRLLPKIGYIELKAIIQSHRLDLFEQFYPEYLKYDDPQKLLSIASRSVVETEKHHNNSELKQREQRNYQQSLQILERILADTDPNGAEDEKVFCNAARDGKLRVVKTFLALPHLNINQTTESTGQSKSTHEGWTALHYACWKGHLEIVKALLEAKIEVNAKTYSGMTALAITEKVLDGTLDFMSTSERYSEQLTNNNLTQLFGNNIGPQKLSPENQQKLDDIIDALEQKSATRDIDAETAEKTQATHFSVVACISATFKNKQHVVLVRKKNKFDIPYGMFLFPCGFYDPKHDQGSFEAGAIREVWEETRIDLKEASCTRLATYKTRVRSTEVEHQFFLFDLGEVERLPFCVAKSDIGEALWVNIDKINSYMHNDELAMSFQEIPLCHSNTIVLQALKEQQLPEEQAMIRSQQLTTENNPANIGSVLFLTFHLQGAYSAREGITDIFEQLKPNIPEGYLQSCFDELHRILKDDQGEEQAKTCVQNLIMHLVKTGVCNVDDMRQKGFPLFHIACLSKKTASIIWLLEQGADVNAVYSDGLSNIFPLSALIATDDLDSARMLIERFAANVTLGQTTDCALTTACSRPSVPDDFIEYLIQKSGVITDELLGTVVHELIKTRRLNLLDNLLDRFHLDLNREYERRQMMPAKIYPILTAINFHSMACVELLAKHGADLTLQHRPNTSLIEFARYIMTTLEGQRTQIIAHLPDHPIHQGKEGYYSMIKSSLFSLEHLSKEELEQKLPQIDQSLIEIELIIAHLDSLRPKPKEPQTLEDLLALIRSQESELGLKY